MRNLRRERSPWFNQLDRDGERVPVWQDKGSAARAGWGSLHFCIGQWSFTSFHSAVDHFRTVIWMKRTSHQDWIHFYKNCVGLTFLTRKRVLWGRVMPLRVSVSSHSWIFGVVSFFLMLDCVLSTCDHAITFILILSGREDGRGTRQRWSPRAYRFFAGEVKKGKKTHASTHKHTLTHFCLKGRCDRWRQNDSNAIRRKKRGWCKRQVRTHTHTHSLQSQVYFRAQVWGRCSQQKAENSSL